MKCLHIITPVKDSIESTMDTIKAVLASNLNVPHTYTIYNDFSTPENTARLEQASKEMGFRLVNLADLTDHPSPNYLLVLQTARREALEAEAGLCIVESDVTVRPDTLQGLYDGATERADCGTPVFCHTVHALLCGNFNFLFRAVFKICVIPRFVPRDFGYGIQAREQQFFEVFRRFHLLRPQCRFVTEHIRTVCVALAHDDRLIMVDLIQ